ncbi:MAG: amino acid ABC transporter permease [Methylocella sp.]
MNGFAAVWQERDVFFVGIANTVSLVAFATLASIPLGALGAIVIVEAAKPVSRLAQALVDFLRCVPFLLLAYLVYYGLPGLGLRLDAWGAGLLTLVVYTSAYLVEIFRAAWMALPRDGIEAARAYGFTRGALYWRIIFPQIAVTSALMVGNQIIVMIKDSALLMIITVPEITFAANFVNANNFSPFAPFIVAVGLYWMLSLIIEAGVRRLGAVARVRRA